MLTFRRGTVPSVAKSSPISWHERPSGGTGNVATYSACSRTTSGGAPIHSPAAGSFGRSEGAFAGSVAPSKPPMRCVRSAVSSGSGL